jgi:hypothetical protein
MTYRKKLIEVALPLEDINREAAREKSIRHGHPSTLHLWWARRPLAACRAVLFASLVDDPSECVAELMEGAAKRRAAEKVLAAQRKSWEARKAVFDKAVAGGVPASSNPPPGPGAEAGGNHRRDGAGAVVRHHPRAGEVGEFQRRPDAQQGAGGDHALLQRETAAGV